MNVFSLSFFISWIVGVALFYTVLRKFQWQVLLCISVILYAISIQQFPMVLISISVFTYSSAVLIRKYKWKDDNTDKKLKLFRNIIVGICIVILVLGRATNLLATLGNSYFTLKAIGYLIDCERYDEESYYEKNFFFYLFYLIFFPSIAQGPFNRYKDFKRQFACEKISFEYIRFMHGIQRFLWGGYKKTRNSSTTK